jgi:hypothetical protein
MYTPIPDLTVFITTRDRPDCLRTALRSVRLQTGRSRIREVFISDNGAEKISAVLKEFQDLPIRYVEAPYDTDFCTHMRLALPQINTPLLAMLHDDDWWHPGHVESSLQALDAAPDAACVLSANLWVASETSTAPPLYFNFGLLNHFAQSNGVEPVKYDWQQVLMLTWIYTPFHLSTLVARTEAVRAADEVWMHQHFLLDRLFYAVLCQRTKQSVVYLPFPSALIRVHEKQFSLQNTGKVQQEGVRLGMSLLRRIAEEENLNFNELWRQVMPRLPFQTAVQLATLAGECLGPDDLEAMGCPPPGTDSPWIPPAAHQLARLRTSTLFHDLSLQFDAAAKHKQNRQVENAKRISGYVSRSREDLARVFRCAAQMAADRMTSVRRSLPGRLLGRALKTDSARQKMEAAARELKKDRPERACALYLDAANLGLDALRKIAFHPLLKFQLKDLVVQRLEAMLTAGEECLEELRRVEQRLTPGRKQEHWARSFFNGRPAAVHYATRGSREGIDPHPLFDTGYFQEKNQEHAHRDVPPLKAYRRLLDQGLAPEAHPRYSGPWLRQYFKETSPVQLQRGLAPLRETPVNLAEATQFAQLPPLICAGVILFQTSEVELIRIVQSFCKAADKAEAAGFSRPLLSFTDNSHEWDAASIARVLGSAADGLLFYPTDSNIGFGRGHNHLMKHDFAQPGVTHYFCLNPDGMLHPDALAELYVAIASHGLPAFIEARQFPSEHPKAYDPGTFETDWCSAGCLIIPKFLFELTSGFDDVFFMYCEDVDLGWRVWELGYKCLVAPRALFFHRVASRKPNPRSEKWMFESGRLLATRWKAPRFTLECERKLVERRNYPDTQSLPPVPAIEAHEPHVRVDFSHLFTFAEPRW